MYEYVYFHSIDKMLAHLDNRNPSGSDLSFKLDDVNALYISRWWKDYGISKLYALVEMSVYIPDSSERLGLALCRMFGYATFDPSNDEGKRNKRADLPAKVFNAEGSILYTETIQKILQKTNGGFSGEADGTLQDILFDLKSGLEHAESVRSEYLNSYTPIEAEQYL